MKQMERHILNCQIFVTFLYLFTIRENIILRVLYGLIFITLFDQLHQYFCSKPIQVITLNINDDWKLQLFGKIYPEFTSNNKIKNFKNFIQSVIKYHGDNCIFNLNEISPNNMLRDIEITFKMIGYKTSVKKYNEDKDSHCYLLAWNPEEYNINFCDQVWFTKSGNPIPNEARNTSNIDDIIKEGMGLAYERSMPVYYIKQLFGNREMFLGQIHCGVPNKHKIQVCEKININGQCLRTTGIPFLVAGNWNCFDENMKKPMYCQYMFSELKDSNYISSIDLTDQNIGSTWKFNDFDMTRFLTPAENKELNKMLKTYEISPNDDLRNEIRTFLSGIIATKDKEYIEKKKEEKSNETVFVESFSEFFPPLFSHNSPTHISDGLITDMVVGWNAKNVNTTRMNHNKYLSDHYPLITFVN
jgi:hypothetical protein